MDMVPGLVDVRHQPSKAGIVIHHDLSRVAPKYRHATQLFRQITRPLQFRRQLGVEDVWMIKHPLPNLGHDQGQPGHLLNARSRHRRPPNQGVEQQANPGLEKNQQQPPLGRSWRSPEWDHHEHD